MPLIGHLPEDELRVAYCDMLDKLIAVGDGDAALLYLYILRHGGNVDDRAAERALHLPHERYERAVFTLNGLCTPAAPAAEADKPESAPQYTGDELRRARLDNDEFAAVCRSAEDALGRTLTEGQLRCLLTAYDHLGLSAGAIIELLAYLKEQKGTVRLADIRRETYKWADMGVVSAQQAQEYLARRNAEKPLSEAIYRALSADPEQPAPKAQRVCAFALSHGFPPEAVALAACRTDRKQGRVSLDYTLGILRRWDELGVHTVSEITAIEPERRPAARAAGAEMTAQPTDAATLNAWEQKWQQDQEEIRRRRLEAEANGL